MGSKTFDLAEAVREGWKGFTVNWKFFVQIMVLYGVVALLSGIARRDAGDAVLLSGLLVLVLSLVQGYVQTGLCVGALKAADGRTPVLADAKVPLRTFFMVFLGSILFGLIVFGGTLLLIVPGIIWGIMFSLFPFVIVDEGLTPVDALKKSAALTRGARLQLFLFYFLMMLLNLFGLLFFMVGLLVTLPVTTIASAVVFRRLQAASVPAPVAAEPSAGV